MRVPLPWLAEYAALPAGATGEQVAADLVRVGLEEEGIHGGGVTGPLVVGRVLEFVDEPQKNGKVIRWCSLDVGDLNIENADGTRSPRGIVCGAHNFLVGDKVVVVLPGAVLPGPFPIAARKTYGHVSDGMICSARELGLGDDHDGIIRLVEMGLDDAPVGTDAIALLGLGEETVEVNVTPDRGYALSVRGVARDYALSTGAAFTDPAAVDVPKPTDDGFEVRLADDAPIHGVPGCDRYVARVVRGVDPTRPSPAWMQRRLEQAGMRPISLAVDVTNYVMLAVGQPLHAFDLDRLIAPVVVRRATAGEKLTTLDDVERTLDPEDLLITDDGGARVLALAGVMGGASSEVTDSTTSLLVEAAHFDPITVARTARRHKLSTEASRRFERGVDTDLADRAAELAVRLLVEHGGGEAAAVTDVDERAAVPAIELPVGLAERVIGVPLTREDVVAHLERIDCRVAPAGDAALSVTPPSWRPDLRIPVDLVEEVARLVGYDVIPSVLPVAPAGRGLSHSQTARRSVSRALAEHGLVEVLTYPFVAPEVHDAFGLDADDARRRAVRLANPLSDEQPEMRTSLLATLLDALRRNVGRGATDVALFETGLVTRPERLDAVAPQLPVGVLPADGDLAALQAAVPPQPRRVAVVMAGNRVLPGWYGPARPADWTDALDAALLVARTLGVDATVTQDAGHAPWHPGRCARLEVDGTLVGHAGELHPKVVSALSLPARTVAAEVDLDVLVAASGELRRAVPVPTFPLAKEDVALVVDEAVPAEAVEAALRAGAGSLLESVRLFDVYTGPQVGAGKKSLAFALRLRAPDRTLTAAEAAAARDAAVAEAGARTGAVLRGA
ncbi:phenylalanine--tRNA ligase subunit beta [Kineosporia sp. A_224]|uniref:phenylalanine--tRNA ligase subunit beta n=1 Tax=Kineosporia sp. A_224 TaxID=1962180 RepID=UPI0018E9BE89|nr:phenylalanine--tRNA ligase subunit beta [Kineosporia sp. A_224]